MSTSTPDPDANETPTGLDAASTPEAGSTGSTSTAGGTDPTTVGAPSDDANQGLRGDEVEIESVVDPTTVRRAPRYKAFFLTGALAGIVLGLAVGISWLVSPAASGVLKPGVYLSVIVLGATTLTTLVAGALAIWADKRSLRR